MSASSTRPSARASTLSSLDLCLVHGAVLSSFVLSFFTVNCVAFNNLLKVHCSCLFNIVLLAI